MSDVIPAYVHVSPAERAAFWQRPLRARTPIPAVGDVIGYRHNPGGPITRALVEWVDPMDDPGASPDWNVWEYIVDDNTRQLVLTPLGHAQLRIREDPWPDVILRSKHGRFQTREARSSDAKPGWLPRGMINDGSDAE